MNKSYNLGLYEKAMPSQLTWEEKMQIAKSIGYDYIEISIDESEEKINRIYMTSKERSNLVQCMFKHSMPIRSMCVSALTKYSIGCEDASIRARGMEIAEKSIILAADLGIRIVMIPGYDVYYQKSTQQTQDTFLKNLKEISLIAAQYGVMVGLETMENNFMNTVWKAMYYVNLINSPYLTIYPDSGNIKNAAASLNSNELQDLNSGVGFIGALHLKETIPGIFREIPYGKGHVDFESVIETAWNMGIRRYVTEFWHTGNEDWKEIIINNHHLFTKILSAQEILNENK